MTLPYPFKYALPKIEDPDNPADQGLLYRALEKSIPDFWKIEKQHYRDIERLRMEGAADDPKANMHRAGIHRRLSRLSVPELCDLACELADEIAHPPSTVEDILKSRIADMLNVRCLLFRPEEEEKANG